MSWRSWVRETAARLGLADEPVEVTLQQALDRLRPLEEAINAGRARLIEQLATRALTADEVASFDQARKQVLATSLILREEMLRVGVPAAQIPAINELMELPRGATAARASSTEFGAVRQCAGCTPVYRPGSAEVAGTFGSPLHVVAVVGFAAAAAVALAVAAHYLQRTLAPEVALQEAITEANVAYFEAMGVYYQTNAEIMQACIADPDCDPATLEVEPPPASPQIGTNPILQGIGGVLSKLLMVGGLTFGGYMLWRVYKDSKK